MSDMKRDWAGRMVLPTNAKIAFVNNTDSDTRPFDSAIMAAIEANGVFGEDLADIFSLSCPKGIWLLNWA